MFKVGAYVSYRSEGVCVIRDIRTEAFNALGKAEDYYVLSPLRDMNSTVYIPVNKEELTSKMQPLLSAEEICALADEAREDRLEWIKESRARSSSFREILASGDRRSIIVMINTLDEKLEEIVATGKKPASGDAGVYKRARKMLFDEFSTTSDLKDEEELMLVLKGQHKCAPRLSDEIA